jgi:hypothetical protein
MKVLKLAFKESVRHTVDRVAGYADNLLHGINAVDEHPPQGGNVSSFIHYTPHKIIDLLNQLKHFRSIKLY